MCWGVNQDYGLIGGIKPVFDESEAQQVKPEVVNQVAEDRTQGMKVSEYYRRFYLENAKIRKDFLQARTSFNS